ncbi:hypothetical protein JCM10212_000476 [Sporobolomyces blumeae]
MSQSHETAAPPPPASNPAPTSPSSRLALPAPTPKTETEDGQAIKLDVGTGEVVSLYDRLGPTVVNSDGTLSRIVGWSDMGEMERSRILRVLGKRNGIRLEQKKEELFAANPSAAGASDAEPSERQATDAITGKADAANRRQYGHPLTMRRRAGVTPPSAVPPTAFPFFHLHPFPHQVLPADLNALSTAEIALSWLVLNAVNSVAWTKLLHIWRARREKARTSTVGANPKAFELLDLNWSLPAEADIGFLSSVQIAALPLHPDFDPSLSAEARKVFRARRGLPDPPESELETAPSEAPENVAPSPSEPPPPSGEATAPVPARDPASPVAASGQPSSNGSDSTTLGGSSNGGTVEPVDVPSEPPVVDAAVESSAVPAHRLEEASPLASKEEKTTTTEAPQSTKKPERARAADAFDWAPEVVAPRPPPASAPPPRPLDLSHVEDSSSIETAEPSPVPKADPTETAKATESFFENLQRILATPAQPSGDETLSDPAPVDVKVKGAVASVSAQVPACDTQVEEGKPDGEPFPVRRSASPPAAEVSNSLLQRISTAAPVNKYVPDPKAPVAPPDDLVPVHFVRQWHTLFVHSVRNLLPEDEIWSNILRPHVPEPVAIRVKRNPPSQRFCLVFVAYATKADRDRAADALDGVPYGFGDLRLTIKPTVKPPTADKVPRELVSRLYEMVVVNFPDNVTRRELIDYFRSGLYLGVAVNRPGDARYVNLSQAHRHVEGSAFFLFNSDKAREMFARTFCSKKPFKAVRS